MSQYLLRVGIPLAEVLQRTRSAQPEQFAGYFANFDFWLGEFAHLAKLRNEFPSRWESMRVASQKYAALHGKHNLDDVGQPYQEVVITSSQSERHGIITRCRAALERMIERALQLGLIDFTRHDELLEIVRLTELSVPNKTSPR